MNQDWGCIPGVLTAGPPGHELPAFQYQALLHGLSAISAVTLAILRVWCLSPRSAPGFRHVRVPPLLPGPLQAC